MLLVVPSMRSCKGRIHSFESFGTLDGPGVRYVVFLQGCPLHCKFCHNPDTWPSNGGTEYTAGAVFDKIMRCRSYIATGGVTLSGGEPLLQAGFCEALLGLLGDAGIHTAIDTSGAIPLNKSSKAIELADMLLLDIKSPCSVACKELTGQGNENALATLEFCESIGKRVWLRHVVVPGITYDEASIIEVGKLAKQYSCVEKLDLLKYHKLGASKWESLGIADPLTNTPALSAEEFAHAKEIVEYNKNKE